MLRSLCLGKREALVLDTIVLATIIHPYNQKRDMVCLPSSQEEIFVCFGILVNAVAMTKER